MENDSLSMNRRHERKTQMSSQKVQHRYHVIRAMENSEVSQSFDMEDPIDTQRDFAPSYVTAETTP